jgi:pimeloyl-ACP methyl ester carboxylesterase
MAEVKWSGGEEHWTTKGDDVRLFLWNKKPAAGVPHAGTIFFVHGSSMASQPTFDLQVPGRPFSSAMDWFCAKGFDCWTMDNEGYGRSSKHRDINCNIPNGAEDLAAGTAYVTKVTGAKQFLMYGISSGALKAALFAQQHPDRIARLALDAFAQAILTLDDSMPTGTYVDMCSKLPLVDPERIAVPTIVMRGEWDGIASFDDLLQFYAKLPNTDKQFSMMAGISHASFQQKNYNNVYHILNAFFTNPKQVYGVD